MSEKFGLEWRDCDAQRMKGFLHVMAEQAKLQEQLNKTNGRNR